MRGEPWQQWEDVIVASNTCKQAAYLLSHRTAYAVVARRRVLGAVKYRSTNVPWSDDERDLLRQANGDYALAGKLLPHRSHKAIKTMSAIMGLTIRVAPHWLRAELKLLRELYPKVTRAELLRAIPRHNFAAMEYVAGKIGLRRPLKPARSRGVYIVDEVAKRARQLGMSVRAIELALHRKHARGTSYSPHTGIRWSVIRRAVEFLDGELYAEWED